MCAEGSPSLTECARQTGLPASTALRLLRTLESASFVARDDDGAYRAGPLLVQLGARALAQQPVIEAARPAMTRLVAATGESTYLSVLGPAGTALYVATVEGTHSVRHTSWAGRTGPLAGSAVGAALTGRVGPGEHLAMGSTIEPDVVALASPVLTAGGAVIAALSLVGPAYRMDTPTAREHGELLAREAVSISQYFGYTPEQRSVRS